MNPHTLAKLLPKLILILLTTTLITGGIIAAIYMGYKTELEPLIRVIFIINLIPLMMALSAHQALKRATKAPPEDITPC